MIYTSYFANWRKFPKNKKRISIARFSPKWAPVDGVAIELAPSADLLKAYKEERITQAGYIQVFNAETLSVLDPREIYDKYDECVLLCYEKTGEFCHRRLVAMWLQNAVGEAAPEIGVD